MKKHVQTLYRFGYISIALVYALTGYLAIAAAFGWGGHITDHEGTLEVIAALPMGRYLLLLIGLGILGYVAWRFTEAFSPNEGKAWKAGDIGSRLYAGASGVVYLLLAWASIKGFLTKDLEHREDSEKLASAELMSWEWGDYILGAAAIGLFAASLYQIYKGLSGNFLRDFHKGRLSRWEWLLLSSTGRLGIAIRGASFSFFAYFIVKTLWAQTPAHAKGTKEVLLMLLRQPFGKIWLTITAFGFICYAFYCAFSAKARSF